MTLKCFKAIRLAFDCATAPLLGVLFKRPNCFMRNVMHDATSAFQIKCEVLSDTQQLFWLFPNHSQSPFIMGRKKKRGRPKGSKKVKASTLKAALQRSAAKRRRISTSELERLKELVQRLKPNRGHNYARRKDSLRVLLLMLVNGFIECRKNARAEI